MKQLLNDKRIPYSKVTWKEIHEKMMKRDPKPETNYHHPLVEKIPSVDKGPHQIQFIARRETHRFERLAQLYMKICEKAHKDGYNRSFASNLHSLEDHKGILVAYWWGGDGGAYSLPGEWLDIVNDSWDELGEFAVQHYVTHPLLAWNCGVNGHLNDPETFIFIGERW